jgi:16S rRNA (guanine527-N7)-methyltransferase
MAPNAGDSRLNSLLMAAGIEPLDEELAEKFEVYLSLILRWNRRLNLTSLRTEGAIISIHLAESIVCARAIPESVKTLLDFGSGAGLPGIPIALCRPEIAVTLVESQVKKAAFLQEAVRTLGIAVKVHCGRAETLQSVFDCVTLRAVDKMPEAVCAAAKLVAPGGWLLPMTTNAGLAVLQAAAGAEFTWPRQAALPGSTERIVAFGVRQPASQPPRSE